MSQPGTTPVGAPIDTYAAGNTYPTHKASRGLGGYRTVADDTEMNAIPTGRREEGMVVWHIADQLEYRLDADMVTWNPEPGSTIDPNDYLDKATYDPTDSGIVVNSQNFGGHLPSWYLDLANTAYTGLLPQAKVNGLSASLALKEDKANKGVANGYVPLNGSIKIDNSYLNFSLPLDPAIAWNPVTNTPTISDAGGAAGEIYIVYDSANPTARNLGSGSKNWYDGDLCIFDSGTSTFQRVGASALGVIQITTDLGVQTGAVTLDDTSYIAPSTDRNYVTDDQSDAFPTGASASDQLVLQSDLTSLIVVGNGVFMPELFSNGHTLGDGTIRRLNTLTNPATGVAYTNVSAGNYWTRVNSAYTINVATMSIDWIAWQEAYLAMEQDGYSKIISPGGRGYCPNQQLDLPMDQLGVTLTRRGLEFIFDWQGSAWYNLTGNDFIMHSRYFTNESQISGANSYLVDYDYHFLNVKSEGNGGNTLADGFIRLGATTHSTFHNIKTSSFGCPINLEFALELTMDNIKHEGYGLYGTKITPGTWTGGSAATSGVNLVRVTQHRCVNSSGKTPTAGIYSGGGGNLTFDTLAFEGYNGSVHHFLSETPGQVAAESALTLTNLYFETAGASRAAIKCVADKGDFFVNKWNNVVAKADLPVFFEFAHKSPPPAGVRKPFVRIENCATNAGGAGGLPKFRWVTQQALGYGPKWVVQYVNMPNNVTLNDPANWDTTAPNSYVPDNSQVINYIPSPV